MKNISLAIVLILSLAACDPFEDGYGQDHSKYVKQGEQLVYCSSPVNIPQEILYYTSQQIVNKMEVPELAEPFSSYYITDVLGNVYSINSDEMNNYECYEVVER